MQENQCSHAGKVQKFTYSLAVDKQTFRNNWNQFENNLYPLESWSWSQLAADKHNKQEILFEPCTEGVDVRDVYLQQ